MTKKKVLSGIGIVMAAFLISSCGDKEREPADILPEEAEQIEVEEPEQTTEEDGVEKKEEEWEENEEPEKEEEWEETESIEEAEEELPDWALAYRDFLTERENLVPLLLEEGEGGLRGFLSGFYLHDINKDGIPELFLQKYWTADYVYTYTDEQMELRNVIEHDAFGEDYLGYDSRNGQAYSLLLDWGTGTDRITVLSSLSLSEEVHDMGETVGAYQVTENGLHGLYGALFGGIEKEDGTYDSREWKDAIPGEENEITPEEFQAVVMNFQPFDYQKITEENIENYITADYGDVVAPCSLKSYQEKMQDRWDEFERWGYPCELENGQYLVPDSAFLTSDWIGDIYCDLSLLACYQEKDMISKIWDEGMAGERKEIYREWCENLDFQNGFDGQPILESEDYAEVCLYDWKGMEAPALSVDSGAAVGRINYFTVIDGQVVNIGVCGGEAIGGTRIVLINHTTYFFKYIDYYIGQGIACYHGTLYRVNRDKVEEVWYIEWQEYEPEFMEEELEEPEYGPENPFCRFLGEERTKEACMAEIDALLGEGATEQLLGIYTYTEKEEPAGPLTFAEWGGATRPWRQFVEMLY